MRVLRLVVSYDGGEFCGWQVQPNGPSIQAELARAIAAVTGETTFPAAAGRTDSGVHALAQIVAWRTESRLDGPTLLRALNANLPAPIVVRRLEEAPADFDPVRQAKWKLYRYHLHDGPIRDPFLVRHVWAVHRRLDVAAMNAAAAALVGRHDFRCFETEWPNRATSVRTVRLCQALRCGDLVTVDVEADGFLYNMVRAIVGTLVEVGRGKRPPGEMETLLSAGERGRAGPTAPAAGLFLVRVLYADDVADTGASGLK